MVIAVGDGAFIPELATRSKLQVIGIDTDPKRIATLREHSIASGIYGALGKDPDGMGAVSLQEVDSFEALPFVDGIFNLITVEDASTTPDAEVKRLLRPWDGLAVVGSREIRSDPPKGAGSWTHAHADPGNSAASREEEVGGAMRLRWFGRPGPEKIVDRHLRAPPPLAAGGYLLVPGRDHLFALDSHNGAMLWEREIPGLMRASMLRDCGNLALDPVAKRVFATGGAKCLVIDADSGKTDRPFVDRRPHD